MRNNNEERRTNNDDIIQKKKEDRITNTADIRKKNYEIIQKK